MRALLTALRECTRHRPTVDSALMKWTIRPAAWLICDDTQSPFYRARCGLYRGIVLKFGECVLVWLGMGDLSDEHLVRTDDGIVRARCVPRCNEQRWSETILGQSPRHHRSRSRRRLTCLLHLTLQLFFPQSQVCQKETRRRIPQPDQSRTQTKKCRENARVRTVVELTRR